MSCSFLLLTIHCCYFFVYVSLQKDDDVTQPSATLEEAGK